MREAKRKIQVTGGFTHILSLPIEWIQKIGLKKGDNVHLFLREDNTILVGEEKKRESLDISITVDEKDNIENVYRLVVAYYLAGYDFIQIIMPEEGFNKNYKKWLKNTARKLLIGLDVVSESSTEIVFRCFINYEDFPFSNILNTIGDIVETMYEDTTLCLREGNIDLAHEVIQRDSEVNRFCLFAIRQLIEASEYSSVRKKIGVNNTIQIFNYRLIVKNVERIGDHIKNIANSVIQIYDNGKIGKIDYPSQFFDITIDIKKLFIDSLEILFDYRIDEANVNINKTKELIGVIESLKKEILAQEVVFSKKVLFITVLNSLERISNYLADINELIINISIEKQ